jgi:hypothetical protein
VPKRIPQDWANLEQDLHAEGVSPEEIEAGATPQPPAPAA